MADYQVWPTDYFASRHHFVERAAASGAKRTREPVSALGPDSQALSVDIASFISDQDKRRIILTSGVHGVEGFIGASVQLHAMQMLAQHGLPNNTGVIMVHAINPWGFAHLRRVNENNIDVNRNFIDFGIDKPVPNPGYATLNPVINPQGEPGVTGEFQYWLQAIKLIQQSGGIKNLAGPIAMGQSDFKKGLFFTGTNVSESTALIQKLVLSATDTVDEIIILDVHSGLGRSGLATLISNTNMRKNTEAKTWLESHFAQSVVMENSHNNAYTAQGSLSRWCESVFKNKRFLYQCVEIGTVGPMNVMSALRRENQAHHWTKRDSKSYRQTKQSLLNVFAPPSHRWRTTAVSQAMHTFSKSLILETKN